jgi:hypothetical protein
MTTRKQVMVTRLRPSLPCRKLVIKMMEEGFAAIDILIKALEEKAIGDDLVLKAAGLQLLTSSRIQQVSRLRSLYIPSPP